MTPQSVRGAQFKTVRKGLDPDEVRVFLEQVAGALEKAQNQSTAMEARARAAVHRLQEVTEAQEASPGPVADAGMAEPSAEQADAITKTLLLAQRTADSTVAEARHEADRLLSEAQEEAERAVSSSQEEAAQLLEEARAEARSVGEEERLALDSDVSALMARRDFLESDVEHLEKFLDAQRERLRDAAATLAEMAERVPAGLGEVHRPVLSAATAGDDDTDRDTDEADAETDGEAEDDTGEFAPDFTTVRSDEPGTDDSAPGADDADDAAADEAEPVTSTDATPVQAAQPDPTDTPDGDESEEDFTLRFGDPG